MRIIGDGGHAKVVKTLFKWAGSGGHICAIGDNKIRQLIVAKHTQYEWSVATYRAFVWKEDVFIGDGTVVIDGAVVQPGTVIGKHCIINTCASVDHDCILGDFVHVAPGARLCGNVTVGEGALIGAGAVCVPGAVIAPWSLVKAGSVAK